MSYAIGYNGTQLTLDELLASTLWSHFDPEFARRLLAIMDASIAAGHPLGIGGGWRSTTGQTTLFLARHHLVVSGGCCTYLGKRYALNTGAAHAAPPGASYHESTTSSGRCLAADMTGDVGGFLKNHAADFGLVSFWNIGTPPEAWHVQPIEIPHARANYVRALHEPLQPWTAPPTPPTPPTPIPPTIPPEDSVKTLDHPQRIYDSRTTHPKPIPAGTTTIVPVFANEIEAVIHVVAPVTSGYLVAWGAMPQPGISQLDYSANVTTSGTIRVVLDHGQLRILASANCHLVIDLVAAS